MKKSTLKRMLELADIKPVIKESRTNLSNFELVKNSVNGNTYAIVRENKRYFIKQSETKNGLTESDFDYVGGLANKMKKSFTSFSDATKHLNLMFEEINNHYDTKGVNLLESDDVLSEKKYVLKLNKPKKEKEPDFDFGSDDESGFDFGSEEGSEEGDEEEFDFDTEEGDDEEFDFGSEEGSEEGDEEEFDFDTEEGDEGDTQEFESEGGDEIKNIQSTTGKLGQQLRDIEDLSSDMQKWVVKSVLSALDLENMDSSDKNDILDTINKTQQSSDEELGEGYDSYMEDESYLRAADLNWDKKGGETQSNEDDDDFDGMDKYFKDEDDTIEEKYHSYMNDRNPNKRYEDNPNIGGDEKDDEKLLFSSKETRNFRLNNMDRSNSNLTPNERWSRHRVPNRTEFEGMDSNMNMLKNRGMRRQMELGETDDIFANSPAPSKPAPTKDPSVKPGKDKPGRENPSKRPFTPPPHITPGEEPGPKAGYDDDVEFE
jgi:hypothetical protein